MTTEMTTEQIVLASRPKGMPTLNNFRFEEIELPDIQPSQVLLKGWYYSVDPYMRGRSGRSCGRSNCQNTRLLRHRHYRFR
jgi:NADPH-dependent curcumin reductase CurA